ncbi:MAG: DUF2851 family protein [Verrucomicrobia bacterium]|nr:DUF2851 family protein [Verrucomicrobiota bacterium]
MMSWSTAFPFANLYNQLRHRQVVHEGRAALDAEAFGERHLQCVWYDSAFRPPRLQTLEGELVDVLNAGRWNLEAGPDFIEARLAIGSDRRIVSGDVEIHIHAQDWANHGHASDPRYQNVVAHITFWPGRVSSPSLPTGAVQISLRDALHKMPDFYFAAIDTAAYPYNAPSPLQDALPREWHHASVDEKRALLRSAGEARLEQKVRGIRLNIDTHGEDQAFWFSLMTALGYKNNRIGFRKLARNLPLTELNDARGASATDVFAILLGVSGLAPATLDPRWSATTKTYIRSLWDIWWKNRHRFESRIMPGDLWQLSGMRPQNLPVRRIAAAANLATRARSITSDLRTCHCEDARAWLNALDNWLDVQDAMNFWHTHLGLTSALASGHQALLGKCRRASIITNVLLPFLAATGSDISPLLMLLPPEEDNHSIKQCACAFFGPDHNPAEYRHGLLQQGLIQIFHDYVVNGTYDRPAELSGA